MSHFQDDCSEKIPNGDRCCKNVLKCELFYVVVRNMLFFNASILENNEVSQNKIKAIASHDTESHFCIQLKIESKISKKYLHPLLFCIT